jgi:hypothetical protein
LEDDVPGEVEILLGCLMDDPVTKNLALGSLEDDALGRHVASAYEGLAGLGYDARGGAAVSVDWLMGSKDDA